MPRVVHFEITADDPHRAAAFYRDVFGWKIEQWEGSEPYSLATTGPEGANGINGAIMKRGATVSCPVNTIDVPSFDEFCEKVRAAGGEVLTPRQDIPGVGSHAYCRDTEGNVFGIIEPKR